MFLFYEQLLIITLERRRLIMSFFIFVRYKLCVCVTFVAIPVTENTKILGFEILFI